MPKITTHSLARKANAYLRALTDLDRFSGSALIAKDGEVLFSKGYGLANREHKVQNTRETKFRLASVSKQFTAMAVLMLQEQGALKIGDCLCKYLPDCPTAWKRITLRHLLNHTSGIPDYMNFIDWWIAGRLPHTHLEVVAPMAKMTPYFEPGEAYSYSNTGYILLGYIVEQVTKKSFGAYLQERIFGPLGMRNSGCEENEIVLDHRATGYERRGDIWVNSDYLDISVALEAGALYSTTEDLLIWDNALYTDQLASRGSLDAMISPAPFVDTYGYGTRSGKEFGRRYVAHSGALNGFRTHYFRFPEDNVCVVALCNTVSSGPASAAKDLAAMLFGEKYEMPKVRPIICLPGDALDRFCGRYELAEGNIMTIERDGARLSVPLNDRAEIYLYPESETVFFRKATGDQVTFSIDDKGRVTGLVLNQGGVDYQAARRDC